MSLAEIEAELDHLGPEELRRVALKSWSKFVEKERRTEGVNECDEDDPRLLAALDEAIAKANATPGQEQKRFQSPRPAGYFAEDYGPDKERVALESAMSQVRQKPGMSFFQD